MATANFYPYDNIPNFFFMTRDELENLACNSDDFEHDPDGNFDDGFFERLFDWQEKHYSGVCFLDDYEIRELEEALEEINDKIAAKAYGYDNRRERDLQESYLLEDIKLVIEPGHYQGCQIALEGHRDRLFGQLNKANRRWIVSMLKKVARRFYLPSYCLAYRFSNGEAGFQKIKDYKPTKRELTASAY